MSIVANRGIATAVVAVNTCRRWRLWTRFQLRNWSRELLSMSLVNRGAIGQVLARILVLVIVRCRRTLKDLKLSSKKDPARVRGQKWFCARGERRRASVGCDL
eukprot:scaffold1829_cov76-Skeletonema_dohrnii-CCMP3373.AAC.2